MPRGDASQGLLSANRPQLARPVAKYILVYIMFLLRVAKALDQARVPYALVGGYAVALHGAVRGTVDVDLAIRLRVRDFQKTERALIGMGLRPRLPVAAAE